MGDRFIRTLRNGAFLAVALFASCGKPEETKTQMMERALSDTKMSDSGAIMLIAKASFRGFEEASTLPPLNGKIITVVTVRGADMSKMPASIVENSSQDINKKMKALQMIVFFTDLDRFIRNATKRNLGDLTVTLKTATFGAGQAKEWIGAYRLSLPAKNFEKYLKTGALETDARILQAERLWKVDFDGFKNFKYSTE